MKNPTGIWARWLELIDSFQFKIEHRSGKKHGNADAMSRAPHLPEPSLEDRIETDKYLLASLESLNKQTLALIQNNALIVPLSNKQIRCRCRTIL